MLRATRRLLRPGGRTAFLTIHPTPGLSAQRRRRAHRAGPVAVATDRTHIELLERAGFSDIVEIDCTTEFAEATRAWIDQWDRHRAALVRAVGADAFEERQAEQRILLRAVDDGLLQRSLFSAVRARA